MKSLMILLSCLILSSCNQTGIGAVSLIKNIVTSPYDAIKGVISDNEYDNLKKKTQNAHKAESAADKAADPKCEVDLHGNPVPKDLEDVLAKVNPGCACIAWANCSKDQCTCSLLCPDNFDILKHPAGQKIKDLTGSENSLAFRNTKGNSKHQGSNGYCWGHANITAQFNRLAFFDKNKKAPYDIDSSDPIIQNQAIKYYKDIIDKVADNKIVDIPHFADLQSLSDHPSLQSHIADKVAENWADHAMGFQGLSVALQSASEGMNHYKKVFKGVKDRLDMHIQPVIVFTKKGSKFFTHATQVSHYIEDTSGMKLCIRDSNINPENEKSCPYFMSINDKGELNYSGWSGEDTSEIGGLDLGHNNNADAVSHAEELREKCLKDKDCKKKG